MLAAASSAAASFDQGDAVPMLRRTQFKGERTEWLELPSASQPRFLRDRTTTLEHVQAETHKLSIAIHGLRFVTPWIVVADGKGRFLSHLELRLTALGNDLSAMRILDAQYVDNERPEHIAVRTVWEQANENDLASALALTFAAAALLATVLLCWTCTRHGSPAFAMLMDEEQEAPRRAQQQQQNTRRHLPSRLGKSD